MQTRLHKNATTTPALRKAIQESDLSERKLVQNMVFPGPQLESGRGVILSTMPRLNPVIPILLPGVC
ncbi:MAG: hypothetical protein Q9M37_08960 [Desulfonauticus sp.]|nr:hypothetical protein [Desulfonauticus sp.]